uniref:General odorant-binding protein 1 n=2 Tax=Heortia vitessoides TaxID=1557813 RepID=A0A978W791_9NEOP|nr:general odorant-binding protein 1 [Heortia vitessoides]
MSVRVARVALAALAALATLLPCLRADHKLMTDLTLGFGQALDHCRKESGLTEEQMEEFFHFWSEDFQMVHRELGCAMSCMSHYFNLVSDVNRMHHENTKQFIKSFSNGEQLADLLITIVHDCEKQFEHEQDNCWRVLHIAQCFREQCNARNLAPTMEMLLAEFIMQAEL